MSAYLMVRVGADHMRIPVSWGTLRLGVGGVWVESEDVLTQQTLVGGVVQMMRLDMWRAHVYNVLVCVEMWRVSGKRW